MKKNLIVGSLCAIGSLSVASCGVYTHHKKVDNVVAIAWTSDGRSVQLVQEVSFKWGFLGTAPHIVDPTHHLGLLALVVDGKERIVLPEYGGWWGVGWALPRSEGRGFVLKLNKHRASGAWDHVCLLVDSSGKTTKCPPGPETADVDVFTTPQTDQLVYRGRRDSIPQALDLRTGTIGPVKNGTWSLRLAASTSPCDMSYSALSPDENAWAVACGRNGVEGLWLVKGAGSVELLMAMNNAPVSLPRPVGLTAMEDAVRPFSFEFGLAWSPDSNQVYYCGAKEGPGLVVDVRDHSVKETERCLTGAVWSPTGDRIVGTAGDGRFAEQRLKQ